MWISPPIEKLKGELIDSIQEMDEEELSSLIQSVRFSSIRSSWLKLDVSTNLPEDAIVSIGSFLDASDLRNWQACSKSMRYGLDHLWKDIGELSFRNILVDGEKFTDADCYTSWYARFVDFSSSLCLSDAHGVMPRVDFKTARTFIRPFKKVSCTLPAQFAVESSGRTFIEMTVTVKFSPEAVRSVVGLIESPVECVPLSLACDRGLSRKYFGLAYGPLTGVVSSQGKYFDDFQTYRARHGLKDYLSMALTGPVSVRVGIYIDKGQIAFFRLPESDYSDWECTGFVYQTTLPKLHPCVMFSHIGSDDSISVTINRISKSPPFHPHANLAAINWNNWTAFAEEGLNETARPPPNSPHSPPIDTQMEF